MARTKKAAKEAPAARESSDKIKNGRVTKPNESVKAKADMSASVKSGLRKDIKPTKKVEKEPSVSESESASDSGSESDDNSGSTSGSESGDESESPSEASHSKDGKTVTNEKFSNRDVESESESESESDDEGKLQTNKGLDAKMTNGTMDGAKDSESGSDASESESEGEGDNDARKTKTKASEGKINGKQAANKRDEDSAASSSASGSGSASSASDSDSASDSEEEKEQVAPPPRAEKKRKAEEADLSETKKARTSTTTTSGSATLFVGNLSWNVDDDWLFREFADFNPTSARIITRREDNKSKGFGYVDFGSSSDCASALDAMRDAEIDGRRVNIDISNNKPDRGSFGGNDRSERYGDKQGPPSDTIFVGNIAWEVQEEQLRETFEPYGTVLSVRLPTDPNSGVIKGFGYVSFSAVEEAQAALKALHSARLADRQMRLDFATPKTNNGGGFRDRGGRGGRGDRGGRGGPRGGRGDSRGGFRGGRGGGGRGGSTNRGGLGDFSGTKVTF